MGRSPKMMETMNREENDIFGLILGLGVKNGMGVGERLGQAVGRR